MKNSETIWPIVVGALSPWIVGLPAFYFMFAMLGDPPAPSFIALLERILNFNLGLLFFALIMGMVSLVGAFLGWGLRRSTLQKSLFPVIIVVCGFVGIPGSFIAFVIGGLVSIWPR